MDFKQTPSPNFNNRPDGACIDMIIIHAMAMKLNEALSLLQKPCPMNKYEVSAHYVIDHDGTIYQLVEEKRRAFHAGISAWEGRTHLNNYSIGIELLNHDLDNGEFFDKPFEEAQLQALEDLVKDIKTRHPINPEFILGHEEVAPKRKTDPGPHFPWQRFR